VLDDDDLRALYRNKINGEGDKLINEFIENKIREIIN